MFLELFRRSQYAEGSGGKVYEGVRKQGPVLVVFAIITNANGRDVEQGRFGRRCELSLQKLYHGLQKQSGIGCAVADNHLEALAQQLECGSLRDKAQENRQQRPQAHEVLRAHLLNDLGFAVAARVKSLQEFQQQVQRRGLKRDIMLNITCFSRVDHLAHVFALYGGCQSRTDGGEYGCEALRYLDG